MAVVAYNVYLDGELYVTIPAPIDTLQLRGLHLGSEHQIAISSVDDAGNESELSEAQTFAVLGLIEGAGVSDAIGQIVTATHVERAVVDTLATWMPAYLDETQRQAIEEMPLAYPDLIRAITDPNHAAHLNYPALEVAAELDALEQHAETVTHVYRVGVQVTLDAATQESSRLMLDAYAAAVAACLTHRAMLGGLADSTRHESTERDAPAEASLVYALVSFRVVVENAQRRYGSPTEPPGPGLPPPADLPVTIIEIDEQLVP